MKEINTKIGVYRNPKTGVQVNAQDPLIAKAFKEAGLEFSHSFDVERRLHQAKTAEVISTRRSRKR